MIITIDGPVASGKSSVAKALAKELEIYYLYTGLLYRAVAYIAIERLKRESGKNIIFPPEFKEHVEKIGPEELSFISDISYDYGEGKDELRPYLFYGKQEITQHLYDSSIDQPASVVSANSHVRDALLGLQRDIGSRYDIIADGRDCGTVVFPEADHKFYLTASAQVRAERLMLDENRGKMEMDVEKVKAQLEERDKRDQEREVAPLVIPEGATIIDNSEMSLQETINKFLRAFGAR